MNVEEPAGTDKLGSKPERAEFLKFVRKKYGEKLRRVCHELLEAVPLGDPCDPFKILMRAKLTLQEPQLQDLAAMNAAPFSSARDLKNLRKKKR